MKYLNGEYYAEVKNHRYKIHPTENIILRKRNPPKILSEFIIKYRMRLRLQEIRKSSKILMMN